jgi:hypothetical protein
LEALRIFDAEREANPDSDIFEKKTNEQLADWGVNTSSSGIRFCIRCFQSTVKNLVKNHAKNVPPEV